MVPVWACSCYIGRDIYLSQNNKRRYFKINLVRNFIVHTFTVLITNNQNKMKKHYYFRTAEKAAKKFFTQIYGRQYGERVKYTSKNSAYTFYSAKDSALDEVYICKIIKGQ